MTTVVTFDAGNTLLYAEPSPPVIYAEHMSRLGRPVDPEAAAAVFSSVWSAFQLEHGEGTDRYHAFPGGEREWWMEFVRRVVEALGHDAPVEPLFESLYRAFTDPAIWTVFPDVPPVLDALRDRGFRLAVISNWDSRLPRLLEELGLAGRFDAIVVSALEGVEKPAAEIFLRAARRLGVPPEAMLHVGDSPREDYHGARAAGLSAVLLDRRGAFADNGFRRIASLEPLPRLAAGGTEV